MPNKKADPGLDKKYKFCLDATDKYLVDATGDPKEPLKYRGSGKPGREDVMSRPTTVVNSVGNGKNR